MSRKDKDDACWLTTNRVFLNIFIINNHLTSQVTHHSELDEVLIEHIDGHVKSNARKNR